ncbi:hypothetical protein RB213_015543, partial [Colletotrichum asianum]
SGLRRRRRSLTLGTDSLSFVWNSHEARPPRPRPLPPSSSFLALSHSDPLTRLGPSTRRSER